MKRLIAWKVSSGRKPLILRGVRQTGKTHLLEQFGREHFPQYHIINFEKQERACSLFDGDLEPDQIVNGLRLYLNSNIDINNDLLIFDEIQACPRALTSLKYFCEDLPKLAVCAAGSLLGLHLNEGSYPVGKVDMLHLYPMTFGEFLAGIGDSFALQYFNGINLKSQVSVIAHQQLLQRLKHYFITGGLPEAVKLFRDHQENLYNAFTAVRTKQSELIKAYYADIAKHCGKVNAMHIDRTWRAIPKQLSANLDGSTNRFKFKGILPNIKRYSQLVNVVDWLEAAELTIKLPIIHHVEHPLSAYTKENIFKLMMFDVGILGALNGLDPNTILKNEYGTYKGYFAENFVTQQLVATGHENLFSWQKDKSEIEFLINHQGDIVPIEVKSATRIRVKSLEKYINMHKPTISIILSANSLRLNTSNSVLHLPLYLAEAVVEMLNDMGSSLEC